VWNMAEERRRKTMELPWELIELNVNVGDLSM
jgi:hypothetical protein